MVTVFLFFSDSTVAPPYDITTIITTKQRSLEQLRPLPRTGENALLAMSKNTSKIPTPNTVVMVYLVIV